jgi:hypothetical protein
MTFVRVSTHGAYFPTTSSTRKNRAHQGIANYDWLVPRPLVF